MRDCSDHLFYISSSNSHETSYNITTRFCPRYQRQGDPFQQQYPIFNQDGKYFTDGFILGIDRIKLTQNSKMAQEEFLRQIEQEADTMHSPMQMIPLEKKSICQICNTKYNDYLEHIKLQQHGQFCRSNIFQQYILQLSTRFDQGKGFIGTTLNSNSSQNINNQLNESQLLELRQNISQNDNIGDRINNQTQIIRINNILSLSQQKRIKKKLKIEQIAIVSKGLVKLMTNLRDQIGQSKNIRKASFNLIQKKIRKHLLKNLITIRDVIIITINLNRHLSRPHNHRNLHLHKTHQAHLILQSHREEVGTRKERNSIKIKNKFKNQYRRRGQALPAEIKSNQTLIQKPQINDPQIDKQMENILYNVARDIRPKGRRRVLVQQYKPRPANAQKCFTQQAFPFKDDPNIKKIIPKFINSPLMPPSLRKQANESINNQVKLISLQSKINKQNEKDALSKFNSTQQSTEYKTIDDQQLEIIASSNPKSKNFQQIQLIQQINKYSTIQQRNNSEINRETSMIHENKFQSAASLQYNKSSLKSLKPQIFFNKSGVQKYLLGLCKK